MGVRVGALRCTLLVVPIYMWVFFCGGGAVSSSSPPAGGGVGSY